MHVIHYHSKHRMSTGEIHIICGCILSLNLHVLLNECLFIANGFIKCITLLVPCHHFQVDAIDRTKGEIKPCFQGNLWRQEVFFKIPAISNCSPVHLSVRSYLKLELLEDAEQGHFGIHQSKPRPYTVARTPPKWYMYQRMTLGLLIRVEAKQNLGAEWVDFS